MKTDETSSRKKPASWLRFVQYSAAIVGALLVGTWVVAWVHGNVLSRRDVARFDAARAAAAVKVVPLAPAEEPRVKPVDTSLWSDGRVEGYQESLDHDFGMPMAVLRIPSIDVVVPVLPGTDDLTLNRGAGWIEGTARPGSQGNIGIAGHRDGFFRGFKDLQVGSEIVVETLTGSQRYVVDALTIVDPSDVSVLAPTEDSSLTLVTCYPFYFVGSAPQRFIVHATLRSGDQSSAAGKTDFGSPDQQHGMEEEARRFESSLAT
jgi:sortase A